MASTTLRTSTLTTQTRTSVTSRRRPTVVAQATSGPFDGLLRIFTPAKYTNSKEDWEGTGSGFKGKISRERKPFKDGYTAQKGQVAKAGQKQVAKAVQKKETQGGFMGYLSAAVSRVVSNNFTGDETEPDWSKTGGQGWSGDVKRGRKKN